MPAPAILKTSRRVLLAAVLVTGALLPIAPGTPAAAQDAPDGSRSHLTQEVVDREPLPGGGWRITIEATLDSNAICHVLLFQCVTEPALAPANLTLERVECLSPGWHPIKITLPFVGTVVDVCARFDAERAGHDQKFRFTYTTPVSVGTVSETARFFRFPEEFFFTRAENTITVDLAAEEDAEMDCPDTAAVGTSIPCTVRIEALSNVPAASVALPAVTQFTNASLTPDANPGDWSCAAATCQYTAGGGTLPVGEYTFTAPADVAGPVGAVDRCVSATSSGTEVASGCDEVQVYAADTDTTLDIEKTAPVTEIDPGAPLTFTITVTNEGPNAAEDVRVFETPPPLLSGAAIRKVSGAGTWTCASAAALQCTTTSLATGGVTTFEVTGTVSASATAGSAIVNEITAEYANDPFGPDFPVRDGTLVRIRGASAPAATAVTATPTFTG
jgi:uncharacterized repeat protein (TIGR01451 family)